MARAKSKPVAMRSKRSGIKTSKLIKKNNEILKRLKEALKTT